MNLAHLILLSLALTYVTAIHEIPIKRHSLTQEHFDKMMEDLEEYSWTNDYLPFRYGKIPLHHYRSEGLGFIPLVNFINTQFYGEVDVGTPGQKTITMFDTGSSNMFVLAPSCVGLVCYNRTFYSYFKSNTFYLNGTLIDLGLGGGNFSGFMGADTVDVGGMKVKNVPFALIDNPASFAFAYSRFDSIIGMAYQDLAVQKIPPVFQLMLNQGLVKDPSFSFYLTVDNSANGSAMILGGINPKYAASEFHYVNLTHKTYYQGEIENFKVGNQSFMTKKMNFIVDSGTSVIVGPNEIINPIRALFPQKIPCPDWLTFDDIHLIINGVDYAIPPSIYIVQDFGHCNLGIIGAELSGGLENTIILGDVWMRAFYTHFDYGKGRIGFAKAANVTTEVEKNSTIEI